MKLKILSDGTEFRVVDADSGREIEGVVGVSWQIARGELAKAVLVVHDVPVELMQTHEFTEMVQNAELESVPALPSTQSMLRQLIQVQAGKRHEDRVTGQGGRR